MAKIKKYCFVTLHVLWNILFGRILWSKVWQFSSWCNLKKILPAASQKCLKFQENALNSDYFLIPLVLHYYLNGSYEICSWDMITVQLIHKLLFWFHDFFLQILEFLKFWLKCYLYHTMLQCLQFIIQTVLFRVQSRVIYLY